MVNREMKNLEQALADRRATQCYRQRRRVSSPPGALLAIDGKQLISFSSNDYLGLAADPRIAQALSQGAAEIGSGAGASHLISGHHQVHHDLEEELAEFVGAERALLFSTGYMANLGVVSGLLGRHDLVVEDRLNHASLIDAARLSRARVKRYRHGDSGQVDKLLAGPYRRKLVTTDAVFSMDGDLAPLPALLQVVARHDAWLLADDAHGLGVMGASGRGSFAHAGLRLTPQTLLLGTLGKAFGTFGAFVAGSSVVIETLIQQARTYIYTTALPPALAVATRESLRLVQTEDWRREQLFDLVGRFRSGARQLGLRLMESATPIQPLMIGEAGQALAVSQALETRGFLVPAIRPPTVPAGSSRLRISLSANHTAQQVDRLLDALNDLMPVVNP